MLIMMALLMTMVAMVTAQGPVDNVLGTDLETSRVLVVEHQRQQYVPSLHVHVFDDNHDYHVFQPHHHHLNCDPTFNLFSKTKLTAAAARASWTGRTRWSEK